MGEAKRVLASILLMMTLTGCGNGSSLKGKVVDGKNSPLAGVKVVAMQLQPVKGYEQFETTTGSDGGFQFGKLFPNSAYELMIHAEGTIRKVSIKTESAPGGETKILPEPVVIRFKFSKDGTTVVDTKEGRMWTSNANIAGSGMLWGKAVAWVKNLEVGGHRDWRLPNKVELEQFAKSGGREKQVEYFTRLGFTNVQAGWYWTANEGDYNGAWGIIMEHGGPVYGNKRYGGGYVWPVRTGQ